MNSKCLILSATLVIFTLSLLGTPQAQANFYQNIEKKQANKSQKRWTLSDWMSTKRKVSLMDQWLALNSSSNPYELYLGADTASYNLESQDAATEAKTETSGKLHRVYYGAYATIVGLEGQYEKNDDDVAAWAALFHLRLLGVAVQNTNLTLQIGIKSRQDPSDSDKETEVQFAGIRFSMYLLKHFGIDGLYRFYEGKKLSNGNYLNGEYFEGRAFIDYSILQIYGRWHKEPLRMSDGKSLLTRLTQTGIGVGLRLYF